MKQYNCIIFLIIVFLLERMSEYAREGVVRVISLARMIDLFHRLRLPRLMFVADGTRYRKAGTCWYLLQVGIYYLLVP